MLQTREQDKNLQDKINEEGIGNLTENSEWIQNSEKEWE